MTAPDLCAVCVALVGSGVVGPARKEQDGRTDPIYSIDRDTARYVEAGDVRIWTPTGYLPLLAVTTLAGSRLCGNHAREEWQRLYRWSAC